jgi:hypothetical protein
LNDVPATDKFRPPFCTDPKSLSMSPCIAVSTQVP